MNNNMTSLTVIWKKGGGDRRTAISNWKLCGGQKIIDSVSSRSDEKVWISKIGAGGYTLATWEIAFAYARWISMELYWDVVMIWCEGDTDVMAKFDELSVLTEAGKDLMILSGVKG